MKNRSWIGMAALLGCALAVQAAETPGQTPAPALEAPPAPALETPAPAEEAPSPILVPDTPPPAAPITTPVQSPPPQRRPQQPERPERTTVVSPLSGQAVVKEDRVNLRSRPLLNSEVVGQLNTADSVDIMEEIKVENPKPGEPAVWFKVGLPSTNFVWISSKFIDPATRTVTATRLNVRAGPGENHGVLGQIDKGTALLGEFDAQGEWLKIPPPKGAYAFIAAHLVQRQDAPPTVAAVEPQPPPPAETVSAQPEVALPPATTAVEPAGTLAPPPTVVEAVEPAEAAQPVLPAPEEPRLVKRVVSREGIVRRSVSIQAPTEFLLENVETRKIVNYLFKPASSDILLRNYEGQRILVTGEELLDERWPNTPVINIEKLRARP